MIKCKIVRSLTRGDFPYSIGGVSEEDWQVVKNFLNSSNSELAEVGYSPGGGGDWISDVEYKLLLENAELLGVEFIEEPY